MQLCTDSTVWDSLNNCLDYASSLTFFNFCQVIYYNVSKWQGRDVKWHKKKCQLFPTKTLNMSIDSDVQGGVCTCMCEGRSDQWRFPLLSSAQQQMGRGCGLVGWVTRIMNLPVVLFNTKKEKRKQKHIQQSTLAFIEQSKQAARRQTRPLRECVALVTAIFCHILGKLWGKKKNPKIKLMYVSEADCQLMLDVRSEINPVYKICITAALRTETIHLHSV